MKLFFRCFCPTVLFLSFCLGSTAHENLIIALKITECTGCHSSLHEIKKLVRENHIPTLYVLPEMMKRDSAESLSDFSIIYPLSAAEKIIFDDAVYKKYEDPVFSTVTVLEDDKVKFTSILRGLSIANLEKAINMNESSSIRELVTKGATPQSCLKFLYLDSMVYALEITGALKMLDMRNGKNEWHAYYPKDNLQHYYRTLYTHEDENQLKERILQDRKATNEAGVNPKVNAITTDGTYLYITTEIGEPEYCTISKQDYYSIIKKEEILEIYPIIVPGKKIDNHVMDSIAHRMNIWSSRKELSESVCDKFLKEYNETARKNEWLYKNAPFIMPNSIVGLSTNPYIFIFTSKDTAGNYNYNDFIRRFDLKDGKMILSDKKLPFHKPEIFLKNDLKNNFCSINSRYPYMIFFNMADLYNLETGEVIKLPLNPGDISSDFRNPEVNTDKLGILDFFVKKNIVKLIYVRGNSKAIKLLVYDMKNQREIYNDDLITDEKINEKYMIYMPFFKDIDNAFIYDAATNALVSYPLAH